MPTISIGREKLFDRIGKHFTDDAFDELCFEFGIELDDVTSERMMAEKERGSASTSEQQDSTQFADLSDEIIYKIEIPANRYDLLCLEGLARSLRTFLSLPPPSKIPSFKSYSLAPATRKAIIKKEVEIIRPHLVCAILRGVSLGDIGYNSFIALQDKLHSNVCRKRTLVSIGTHDLDRISSGDIIYTAKEPKDIKFQPLKEDREFRADELMQHYQKDLYLKPYLPIISNSPVFPIVHDSQGNILSLPPIINSTYSKMTPETKNIFIEVTATDATKAVTVLDILVCAFSEYCTERPYEVEQVIVERESDSSSKTYPVLSYRKIPISLDYINSKIGINLADIQQLSLILFKMGLSSEASEGIPNSVNVIVPPDRPDILHACDIMEDAAIGFGFNRIPVTLPKTFTIATEQPLNKLTDALRRELAFAGFTEVLTLTLCSKDENYRFLKRENCEKEAVMLSNPQTVEFEIVRTSLLPGALKTISSNKFMPLPLRIFEIADVVLLDQESDAANCKSDVGAKNERHLLALIADSTSGLEMIRGLIDRLCIVLSIAQDAIEIRNSKDGAYFEGRQAQVFFNGQLIGTFGIVHPETLEKFEVPFAVSALELNIEPFL